MNYRKKDESSISTLKVMILGTVLITTNCFWIVAAEGRTLSNITIYSLFPNVIFTLVVLAILNLVARKRLKFSLTNTELAVIYIMLSIGTSLAGRDMIRQLIPMISSAHWYATEENQWRELFFQHIPHWLVVENRDVLEAYYEKGSNFWRLGTIRAWLYPILTWASFIIVLFFVTACISIIIRKQWTEHEKLSYPIIQLPFEISANTSKFFSNRLLWLGLGIAFAMDSLAAAHALYPPIPSPRLNYYVAHVFTGRPWNAIGRVRIEIYPFVIGLGYFIPLDLSFSLWFFWIFGKIQRVFFSAAGWSLGGSYFEEQRVGAWIGIGVLAIWTTRKHIKKVFLNLFSEDQSYEPLARFAFLGLGLGLVFITLFWHYAGMSLWVIVSYFGIYLVLSLTITRMRAELGPPIHELHYMYPDKLLTMTMGTRSLGPKNLTLTTLTNWIAHGYRSHPMPHQLEGFKISERLNMNAKKLIMAICVAMIVGTFAAILAYLTLYHKYAGYGSEFKFRLLEQSLNNPTSGMDSFATKQMGFGVLFTSFLMIMRRRFLWWPLHPVGYALGSGFAMGRMWSSIMLGWLAKRTLISYGGLRVSRNIAPLFLGLILGQFVSGSLWSIIGLISKRFIYEFFG